MNGMPGSPKPMNSSRPRIARAATVAEAYERTSAVVEGWLERVIPEPGEPPSRLHLAMREAVFPGGKRVRPMLSALVADSYGRVEDELVGRMAAAVELVHCASLVHDDLPAFDDADLRRGKPSCHVAFGEPTAILVGDALLTLAFETLARARDDEARAALHLVRLLTEATGSRSGIIGGQGLELQTNVDVVTYHAQKTSALFRAAAAGGAIAARADADLAHWARFGELVGCALQLRDDLSDVSGTVEELGKPVGQDAVLGRLNAVHEHGETEVRRQLDAVLGEAATLLHGEDHEPLRALLARVAGRA